MHDKLDFFAQSLPLTGAPFADPRRSTKEAAGTPLGTVSSFTWQRRLMKYNGFLGLGVLGRRRSHKSMDTLDATAVAQLAVQLGLVTPNRMEEVGQEVDSHTYDDGHLM